MSPIHFIYIYRAPPRDTDEKTNYAVVFQEHGQYKWSMRMFDNRDTAVDFALACTGDYRQRDIDYFIAHDTAAARAKALQMQAKALQVQAQALAKAPIVCRA